MGLMATHFRISNIIISTRILSPALFSSLMTSTSGASTIFSNFFRLTTCSAWRRLSARQPSSPAQIPRRLTPLGDGWWLQDYNRKLLRSYTWKQTIKGLLPEQVRRTASRLRYRLMHDHGHWRIDISSPRNGEIVGSDGVVKGCADLPPQCHLWVLA